MRRMRAAAWAAWAACSKCSSCEKKTAVLVMAVSALHTLPLPGSNMVRWISFTDEIDHVQVPCVANLHN
jgi:hypothetical protein